jgi:UDP-N-acetylmuramate--alanine ligase
MSGLAEIMHTKGHVISGSDMKASSITKHLETLGITIFSGHTSQNISVDLDMVIYTSAVSHDNPELMKAKELGIHTLSRSQFLGLLMKEYTYPICIAGTHGKTTTTSMLCEGLVAANVDPTVTVGGILKSLSGNIRIGNDFNYFLTEACEYCDSFLDFFPHIGVILNIEEDHLDYFKDLDAILNSFQKFALKIPTEGLLVVNAQIENLEAFIDPLNCNIATFGMESSCDWHAKNIVYDEKACPRFDVFHHDVFNGSISLHVPGTHNLLNCLATCAVFDYLGLPLATLNKALTTFTGADKRFELKGVVHGITVIDDYAHHPTEIKATLEVANKYPHKNLFVIFQPHTYTRTKLFLDDFAHALKDAGTLILTDIYAAREKDPGDIHSKNLVAKLQELGKEVIYLEDFDEIADYLLTHCEEGDVVLTMGAGDVSMIGNMLLP